MKKLTKQNIEAMAFEVMAFLKKHEMDSPVHIYFNGKRMNNQGIEEGKFNPHDYFEYSAYDHILSMSFESNFYDVVNFYYDMKYCDSIIAKFNAILDKYGVYYELGNAWNLTVFPRNNDMEIEYTYYDRPKEKVRIHNLTDTSIPKELRVIGMAWRVFQEKVGDVGSCVLGAGFSFEYQGQEYFLTPCSRFQGSLCWETHVDIVKNLLETIGATDIYYDCGHMD